MPTPQSVKNHTRWDPLFHFFLGPIFLLNVIFTIVYAVHHYDAHRHLAPWLVVMSLALLVLCAMVRRYALKVQDRVIRLEERMRLAAVATPGDLIELDSLTTPQYVALRFASNPELPHLARRAVRENLTNKQIKEAIVAWRPDNDRV